MTTLNQGTGAQLVPKTEQVGEQTIPPQAARAGMRGDLPFAVYAPNTATERLLFAVLMELQRISDRLDRLAPDDFHTTGQEASAEQILEASRRKRAR